MDGLRELALQGTHGGAGGARGRRIDQIGDRFGLRQIHLAVEKGAAAEFAGFGQPGAEVEAAGEQHLHDDRAAVALQFEDVFAGKRMRIREKQQNSAVDRSRRQPP